MTPIDKMATSKKKPTVKKKAKTKAKKPVKKTTTDKPKTCQKVPDKLPPFREIKGKKNKYPQNETEWKKECKKARAYQKKVYKAACDGTKPPKRNYYYETLLTTPDNLKKRVLRGQHREILRKQGKIPPVVKGKKSKLHVHHNDGVYDLEHTHIVTEEEHKKLHAADQ